VFPSLGFVGQLLFAWLVGIAFWFGFERAWQTGQRLLQRTRSLSARTA
jgi:hypothetical protein